AVVVENNIIEDIIPLEHLRTGITVIQHVPVIAPAFIDIQIYGASSKLFSVFPDADTLFKMEMHCKKGGTKYFLPTIATNTVEVLKKGIDAIRKYWDLGGKAIPGLHIEGPWINKIKKGAHLENLIHSPEYSEVKDLLDYGKGAIKIITLAPEVCSKEIIELIKSYDIIISAGHSNSPYNEATNFFKDIHLATHLFNAMSPLHHREPGLPAAVMLHPDVMVSIVADGYHVDFNMIRLAKKLMGERLFFITDAVTETSEGPYPHVLNGDKYESNGILSGSALSMMKAVKNAVEKCDIALDEALRMANLYPAKVLGIDNVTGRIEKGYKADLVLIDENLKVVDCV
ncbi:MAG: N-acetylglucosamine-6-phosphate deacetylase, partial [Bacteroidota bacterium]|nr:N-acetylglucosamine-6-phosphate deacetylase [Bacteroidota bacterium]